MLHFFISILAMFKKLSFNPFILRLLASAVITVVAEEASFFFYNCD